MTQHYKMITIDHERREKMKSYTNIVRFGSYIHHFYIEDGERKYEKVKFEPVLAYEAEKGAKTGWHDIYGMPLHLKKFDSMGEARDWIKNSEGMFDVFGNINPLYQFISFNYPNEVPTQKEAMRIANIDIETPSMRGFPNPDKAVWPVVSITVQDMVKNTKVVFGLKGDYVPSESNVRYAKFQTENQLLEGFIDFMQEFQPDIITGWNIEIFDIPYLVNRIRNLLGENEVKKLSPIGLVNARTVKIGFSGKEETVYDLIGITTLDYIHLYKKFSREVREAYSLDHIAKMELGEGKLAYDKKGKNLWTLHLENFQQFIDYNVKDVDLVYEIDKKLMFIDLVINVGYMAHALWSDCMGTVKIWDALLYNKLLHRKIMVPPQRSQMKKSFPGGFVMDPKKGIHDWIDIYDIASSYPNQTRAWNISPETIVDYEDLDPELKQIREEFINLEDSLHVDNLAKIQQILQKHNVSFTANGEFYRLEKEGIIPETMGEIFNDRLKLKHQAQEIANEIAMLEHEIKELEA